MLQDGSLGFAHGQRPHLTLTASIEALRGLPGASPAEVTGIGPVHTQTARRLACDAVCTTVAVARQAEAPHATHFASADATGGNSTIAGCLRDLRPLSVGRATRIIPAHIRTALHVRDKGCRFPGCDRPPHWTDGHHINTGRMAVAPRLPTYCRCADATIASCMRRDGR